MLYVVRISEVFRSSSTRTIPNAITRTIAPGLWTPSWTRTTQYRVGDRRMHPKSGDLRGPIAIPTTVTRINIPITQEAPKDWRRKSKWCNQLGDRTRSHQGMLRGRITITITSTIFVSFDTRFRISTDSQAPTYILVCCDVNHTHRKRFCR